MKNLEITSAQRAASFKETRNNRFFEIAEDYTELIADLDLQGEVRVCDIAKAMGISHVSVIKTIKRLERDGYLNKNPSIQLTAKGQEMANFSKQKHVILTQFLLKIGVPEHIAATDVEGIEHHISPTTLEAIAFHLKNLS